MESDITDRETLSLTRVRITWVCYQPTHYMLSFFTSFTMLLRLTYALVSFSIHPDSKQGQHLFSARIDIILTYGSVTSRSLIKSTCWNIRCWSYNCWGGEDWIVNQQMVIYHVMSLGYHCVISQVPLHFSHPPTEKFLNYLRESSLHVAFLEILILRSTIKSKKNLRKIPHKHILTRI